MGDSIRLEVYFVNEQGEIRLDQTVFFHPLLSTTLTARVSRDSAKSGSVFRWTTAVRAMAQLLIRARLAECRGMSHSESAVIEGVAGSPAASLDAALSRAPNWLLDMFGTDSRGTAIAQKLFLRSNAQLKRPGPVSIGLNPARLPAEKIHVFLDGTEADSERLQSLFDKLASH